MILAPPKTNMNERDNSQFLYAQRDPKYSASYHEVDNTWRKDVFPFFHMSSTVRCLSSEVKFVFNKNTGHVFIHAGHEQRGVLLLMNMEHKLKAIATDKYITNI